MSNMSPLRRLVHIRAGGQVERCHGYRHFGTYQNSQHQWGVAMIMWTLWPEDFPRLGIQKIKNCDSLELYMWCCEQRELYGVRPVIEIQRQLDSFYKTEGRVQLLPEARQLYEDLKLAFNGDLTPTIAGVVETIAEGGTWR